MRCTSGLFASIEWAICFMIVVFPALGGETIIPRWPLPIGESRSMIRVVTSAAPGVSSLSFASGNSGVRSSNRGRFRASSGASPAHRVDADEGGELLVGRRRTARPFDVVPLAQREAARLADRDVDVRRARQVALGPDESVALVAQVEQAADRDELALVLRLLSATLQLALAATGRRHRRPVRSRPRRRRPRRFAGLVGDCRLLGVLAVAGLLAVLAVRPDPATLTAVAGPVGLA